MSKLEFQDVSFGYSQSGKNSIVQRLTATFEAGQITVLTGPSGCGKSTVLYLAAGIYPQNAGVLKTGKILIDDQNIGEMPPEKRCTMVGMMFQNPDLQFCMDTVENEILFCLGNIGTPRNEMEEITRRALEFCGIIHLKKRLLHSLSGGEKQKAMLASLVALRPRWLLLDEPFANIDEASAADLVQKVAKLHEEGIGILVVDHRLDYWLPVADEIRLMDAEKGISSRGYRPQDLTSEMLVPMGILPPDQHYRSSSAIKTQEPSKTVLELNQLSVDWGGKSVLDQVSFQFQQGKVYGIMGASGSGKSTLFGAVQGLFKYKGEILLNGEKNRRHNRRKAGSMGFVTQNPMDQFVADTVLKEIEVSVHNRDRKAREDSYGDVERILREIGLWGYRNFSPYMLSQGQQRRLGVAALLNYDCQVLFCDEPTYAQDWKHTVAVMDSLLEKTKERGMTLIFSTHDSKLVIDYADVILQLKEGKLVECDKSCL